MNPILKNILAVIIGWIGGSAVNYSLVMLGYSIFPLEGIDPNNMEQLAAAMPNLEGKHFIFPFLAHALGTLAGAFIAGRIAATHKMKFALGIGFLFLAGGIMAGVMLPAPVWYTVIDLLFAYLPMAWIGGKWASRKTVAAN